MKQTLGATLMMILLTTHVSEAAIPLVYTNQNLWTSEHDQPTAFTRDSAGNVTGHTKTGKVFYQYNIENSLAVRLQRFEIDEAYFYISDRGIIIADSDTVALSIYLTRVG